MNWEVEYSDICENSRDKYEKFFGNEHIKMAPIWMGKKSYRPHVDKVHSHQRWIETIVLLWNSQSEFYLKEMVKGLKD